MIRRVFQAIALISVFCLVAKLMALAEEESGSRKIFEARCASCHKKDGKGNPNIAAMFKVNVSSLDLTSEGLQKETDEAILKIIAQGKGRMPSFSKQLKEEEMKSLVAYIRSLAVSSASGQSSKEKPSQAFPGKAKESAKKETPKKKK